MRLVLIGYGRMGRLVEELSSSYGFEVADRLDIDNNASGEGIAAERLRGVDVAIDFSDASALAQNLPRVAALGINLVVGTTGWQAYEADLKQVAVDAGIGVVAAPNFSLGVNLFQATVERAAGLFRRHDYGTWVHELHHAAKQDAPSGTALALIDIMKRAGYGPAIDVASNRAGSIPGIHTVGFDGPSDTVTLTHTTRDRATFARGALEAARWIHGKRGWFTMRDVLGLEKTGEELSAVPRGGGEA